MKNSLLIYVNCVKISFRNNDLASKSLDKTLTKSIRKLLPPSPPPSLYLAQASQNKVL